MKKYLLLLLPVFFLILLCKPAKENRTWIERAVDREFAFFQKKGITLEALETSWAKLQRKPEFCRFKIINSKVYGKPSRIKNLLEHLVATGEVPDVDFIYYNEDRIKKSDVKARKIYKQPTPILVSAKDASLNKMILFSDWLYDPKDESHGWIAHIDLINTQAPHLPWEKKADKLFWRGSPFDGKRFDMYNFDNWTQIPRGQLVYQSRRFSDLIDAAFSAYPNKCAHDLNRCLKEMGPATYVPIQDQLQYKYQILLDGVTCTFPGTHWKLLSGALVFK